MGVSSDAVLCLPGLATKNIFAATPTPAHVFSETDRLMAHPQGIRRRSAGGCRDWAVGAIGGRPEITPHDGLVRPRSSASSRHPRPHSIGQFASPPATQSNQLCLDLRVSDGANQRAAPNRSCSTRYGDGRSCAHDSRPCLDETSRPQGGLRICRRQRTTIETAVARATQAVVGDWESERPVPPAHHLEPHPRRRARDGCPRPDPWR